MYILGINISNITKTEVLRQVSDFLTDGRQHWIATVNPEIILKARKDEEYKNILSSADLRVADGVGIILASWFLGGKLKERITGVDLVYDIFRHIGNRVSRRRAMIIGADQDSREKAGARLRKLFSAIDLGISAAEINIDGKNKEDFLKLSKEIKDFYPQILFVAFGAPRQEEWIYENLKLFPSVKLAVGVGGAIDMISGKLPRAPRLMRKMGLEWLWRLILEPYRAKRVFKAVIAFPCLVIRQIIGNLIYYHTKNKK